MNTMDLTVEQMDRIDFLANIATPVPDIADKVRVPVEAVERYLYGEEPA